MHIIFVCQEYPIDPNQPTGGFGRYVQTISKGLVAANHSVTVLCQGKKNTSFINADGVDIYCLKALELPRFFSKRMRQFLNYPLFWSFSVWRTIVKRNTSKRIDIIEAGDFAGELFFYFIFSNLNVPTVIKLHTPSFIIRKFNHESNTFFYRILYFLEVFCLKKATGLNSPTKSLAKFVGEEIHRPITTIIPYPVDITNKQFELYTRIPQSILYAGKLQPKKGIFTLIKSAAAVIKKIPTANFLFVGPDTVWNGDSVKKQLEEYIQVNILTKNISISPELSKEKLIDVYKKSEITVIPSIWENFPNVCLEAMMNGSLVIASNVGGVKEIITDKKTGFLVEPEDSKALSYKIISCLRLSASIKKMVATQAKESIKKRYGLKKITYKTLTFYKTCLSLSPQ